MIEAWGNGLKSIAKSAKEYNLPAPKFIEMPETFRVNLYRSTASVEKLKSGGTASVEKLKSGGTASVEKLKNGEMGINTTQMTILSLLSKNPKLICAAIAE